ncbi:MAG: FAD-dependent oxidoreductase [Candidatus Rokubacteria bacterium]|nr:FAD-dependent oxidoreductase [Candidatus Rokubacteria bacterium]
MERPRVVATLPRSLYLETTNRCDSKCRTCARTFNTLEPPKDLTLAELTRIVEQFPALDRVVLHGIGEPLLNPELFPMIAYLKAKGATVLFNSDAITLTPARARRLIESGLDEYRVSMDAATRETYLKVRGVDRFDRVVGNVQTLVDLQRTLDHATPRVSLWFTAMRCPAASRRGWRKTTRGPFWETRSSSPSTTSGTGNGTSSSAPASNQTPRPIPVAAAAASGASKMAAQAAMAARPAAGRVLARPSTSLAPRVVIVGGGFAGVTAALELAKRCAGVLPVHVTLLSDRNFFLFTPMLAEAATGAVEARHVLYPIRAWTAGNRVSPVVEALPLPKAKDGRLLVNEVFEVQGIRDVYALGDNACQMDPHTGQPYVATAQVALRQARVLAENLEIELTGRARKPFRFRLLGEMVPLSRHTAVADLKGLKLVGFPAWWIWKTVYMLKLPTLATRTSRGPGSPPSRRSVTRAAGSSRCWTWTTRWRSTWPSSPR